MKLEKLYHALQERYPVEQEKKAAAEKAAKEELKKEISTTIQRSKYYIENHFEEVYKAYEKVLEGQKVREDNTTEYVYITSRICENYIDHTIHVNGKNAIIERQFESNIFENCEHINDLLRKSYCYARDKSLDISVERDRVHFDYYLQFNLTECITSIRFFARPSACGGFNEEERRTIEKFISDIKEIFPNSEEIPKPTSCSVDLTVTFKCLGVEISDLGKSELYSESSSNVKENDLADEQKLLYGPIDKSYFGVRAYNVLIRNGIFTIENLVQLSESQLMLIKNIGPKTVTEIKQKLQELGLTLRS